nr:DUF1829 domain-containing protein [Herbaspirillum sp. ASV7]
MIGDALSQANAETLMHMPKMPATADAFSFPALGGRIGVPLVSRDGRERFSMVIKATEDNFALRKHSLVQAILAVNDLFYVARANVESFFFEDVALWLDDADVRYTPKVNFVGHSRYNHQFDFVVPKSRRAPKRILRVINNPNKDNAQSAAFAWVDTKDVRPPDSLAFAALNDRDRKVSDPVKEALLSYDITPIVWSKREEFRGRLVA